MSDSWKTVSSSAEGLYKDKGSRFVSYLYPVKDEDEIKDLLIRIKKEHHSARHHCYAWRLGEEEIRERANDDGEPSSTAGKPILGQLVSHDLTDVLLVVVRYFGGTLLGVSGLISAYREAAADAIQNAVIEVRHAEEPFQIECSYNELSIVMQIIKNEGYSQLSNQLTDRCLFRISIRKSDISIAESLFGQLYGVRLIRL
jgi:uncharacterized YigZ family protein